MIKAFTYYGAKQLMFRNLLPFLEIDHKIYVEVFGGSAFVLLNKKKSDLEVYNDIYSEVVNFFRVIRNEAKLRKLQDFISNTVYSREDFDYFKKTLLETPVDYKRAAKFFYLQMISFSGEGRSFTVTPVKHPKRYKKKAADLDIIRERFLDVVIENLSFERLLDNIDSEEVLFYLDPPYLHKTRKDVGNYKYEMNDNEHMLMIEKITSLRGKVILSGYRSDLYDTLLDHGFIRKDFEVLNPTSASQMGREVKAIESLYLSRHFKYFEKRRSRFFKV